MTYQSPNCKWTPLDAQECTEQYFHEKYGAPLVYHVLVNCICSDARTLADSVPTPLGVVAMKTTVLSNVLQQTDAHVLSPLEFLCSEAPQPKLPITTRATFS